MNNECLSDHIEFIKARRLKKEEDERREQDALQQQNLRKVQQREQLKTFLLEHRDEIKKLISIGESEAEAWYTINRCCQGGFSWETMADLRKFYGVRTARKKRIAFGSVIGFGVTAFLYSLFGPGAIFLAIIPGVVIFHEILNTEGGVL